MFLHSFLYTAKKKKYIVFITTCKKVLYISYGTFLWLKIVKNWVLFSYDAFLWLKMGIQKNGRVLVSVNVCVFIPMVLFYD